MAQLTDPGKADWYVEGSADVSLFDSNRTEDEQPHIGRGYFVLGGLDGFLPVWEGELPLDRAGLEFGFPF